MQWKTDEDAKENVGELMMTNEWLDATIEKLEQTHPFPLEEVEAMSQAVSPSWEQPYGLARVLRSRKISRSGFYARWKGVREPAPGPRRRREPDGPCDDATLREHIRRHLKTSPWHGEGHRKMWTWLRLRENGLLAPVRAGRVHGPKAHDWTITTQRPDKMGGTDMTSTVTLLEETDTVFVAVNHAIHAAKSGNRFEALEPIRQGMRDRVSAYSVRIASGLAVRHDHGSAYLSDVFQNELRFLGAARSPAFIREPEGNRCPGRFIRTLKENLLWVRSFPMVEELRQALLAFKDLYNHTWLLERHGFKTPDQTRAQLPQEAAA